MRIEVTPEDYFQEYNRKTDDFGNGRFEIVTYPYPHLKYLGNNRSSALPARKPVLSDQSQEERTRSPIHAIRSHIAW